MDKFEVLDLIGEGSFGRVFRGRSKETGGIVALKLIPKKGHSEREIRSLRSECKIQRELSHPNIVHIFDAFETDNEVISVAEYVPGELYRLFDQYKLEAGYRRLPEARVQEIAGDLVSALHYLHSHRILHRDIKPQNILLDHNGKAKLCDFGFARNLGMNTFVLTSIKGTPLYMAPELIEEKPYDHNADLWSMGCILYELLVGQPPFSTNSLFQLIKKIRYECIQWPAHLSPMAMNFLQGLLEKDSKRRLSWPELPEHGFVVGKVNLMTDPECQPLTRLLSTSQELAKEIQRQVKAKLLPGGSQTLIRVAQKHEQQKMQIAALQKAHSLAPRREVVKPQQRRFSDVGHGGGTSMLLGKHGPRHITRRMSEFGQQLSMLPSIAQAQYIAPLPPLNPHILPSLNPPVFPLEVPAIKDNHSPLQFISTPLQAGSIQMVKPEPVRALAVDHPSSPVTKLIEIEVTTGDIIDKNLSIDSNETLKNVSHDEEAISAEIEEMPMSENEPIENDEWCEFLDSQLEEMLHDIDEGGKADGVNNKNFLEMVLPPLRNKESNTFVLHKIGQILILPLVNSSSTPDDIKKTHKLYKSTKLVQHLVVAIKNVTLPDEQNKNNIDVNNEIEQCLGSLTCLAVNLIHSDSEFLAQLIRCFCSANNSVIFKTLFDQGRSDEVTSDALAILCKTIGKELPKNGCLRATLAPLIPHCFENVSKMIKHQHILVNIRALTATGLMAKHFPSLVNSTQTVLGQIDDINQNNSNNQLKKASAFAYFWYNRLD